MWQPGSRQRNDAEQQPIRRVSLAGYGRQLGRNETVKRIGPGRQSHEASRTTQPTRRRPSPRSSQCSSPIWPVPQASHRYRQKRTEKAPTREATWTRRPIRGAPPRCATKGSAHCCRAWAPLTRWAGKVEPSVDVPRRAREKCHAQCRQSSAATSRGSEVAWARGRDDRRGGRLVWHGRSRPRQ